MVCSLEPFYCGRALRTVMERRWASLRAEPRHERVTEMKAHDRAYFDQTCCRQFDFEGDSNGILLLHGFGGSVAHMRPLGDALHERGFTVKGVNLPGHAVDEAAMGETGWQDWLQAAKEATVELRKSCETVTVCGLSMGGVLALLIAEQMKIDACVPISAPMATRNKLMPLAGILAPFYPRISWASQERRHPGLDREYDFGYSGFPTRKAADLSRLIHLARRNLFNITCPILCVQSGGDEVIWRGSADRILNGVDSEDKQKLWLKDAPHVCTISHELTAIVDAVTALVQWVAEEARKN